jgi:hypothetical protein
MSVVLGERMAETVLKLGVRRERVRIIQNWADGNAIRPVAHGATSSAREWRLAELLLSAIREIWAELTRSKRFSRP